MSFFRVQRKCPWQTEKWGKPTFRKGFLILLVLYHVLCLLARARKPGKDTTRKARASFRRGGGGAERRGGLYGRPRSLCSVTGTAGMKHERVWYIFLSLRFPHTGRHKR